MNYSRQSKHAFPTAPPYHRKAGVGLIVLVPERFMNLNRKILFFLFSMSLTLLSGCRTPIEVYRKSYKPPQVKMYHYAGEEVNWNIIRYLNWCVKQEEEKGD